MLNSNGFKGKKLYIVTSASFPSLNSFINWLHCELHEKIEIEGFYPRKDNEDEILWYVFSNRSA